MIDAEAEWDNWLLENAGLFGEYMFDEEKWDNNEWIESDIVQEHFGMTFSECINTFGFCRQAEWNKPPLNGQKIKTYFRKYK